MTTISIIFIGLVFIISMMIIGFAVAQLFSIDEDEDYNHDKTESEKNDYKYL